MLKRSRLFVSLALLVQSFTLFILFIILCVKKKSIAAAFLAVSAMEGVAGTYLLHEAKEEFEENDFDPSDYLDEDLFPEEEFELDDDMLKTNLSHGREEHQTAPKRREIHLDDTVTEDEFKNH